ncbi:uncharacterized protein LOC133390330 isoform X5 [Rhineura floridana]|uniref:uncharacterized protein LOC133390330 isoform X5 n=1 Tax=Rhineura floridana TaxID=261503 RepID=UPI002AC82B80|nr:uncharacterized protein LOC133390330 isoform X5 [Rhineura floridana]
MCSVALLISSPKYLLFLCPADSNPKEKREDVSQKGEAKENISPSARIQEKRDLCMFLALHMENSPYCGKPKSESPAIGQFSKTGIVICEGLKFERIVAMDCSTENLHAVQKALLRLPDEQKGRQVFLSRIPCISCVKFLVQDTYNKGEGTVIYKENSIVSVGYSGFPKGTMYDLFKKKNDGSLNHRIVVCAEANALILGPKDHLKGAELITTKEPCDDCKLLIEEKGIIRTIYPIRSKEMPASQRPSETNREEEALVDDARDNTE